MTSGLVSKNRRTYQSIFSRIPRRQRFCKGVTSRRIRVYPRRFDIEYEEQHKHQKQHQLSLWEASPLPSTARSFHNVAIITDSIERSVAKVAVRARGKTQCFDLSLSLRQLPLNYDYMMCVDMLFGILPTVLLVRNQTDFASLFRKNRRLTRMMIFWWLVVTSEKKRFLMSTKYFFVLYFFMIEIDEGFHTHRFSEKGRTNRWQGNHSYHTSPQRQS